MRPVEVFGAMDSGTNEDSIYSATVIRAWTEASTEVFSSRLSASRILESAERLPAICKAAASEWLNSNSEKRPIARAYILSVAIPIPDIGHTEIGERVQAVQDG